MQNLDVISVNIWQMLASLLNLVLLFLLVKFFLYVPVKKILAKREAELEDHYVKAEAAENEANENRKEWEDTLSGANERANEIIKSATESAKLRSQTIISDAESRADSIVRQAEVSASLEMKKAQDGIKREIVEVSSTLSEKLLEREINPDDHRALIDSFIEQVGESDE
jgi:F-type H+-transporting ATPase subunit b